VNGETTSLRDELRSQLEAAESRDDASTVTEAPAGDAPAAAAADVSTNADNSNTSGEHANEVGASERADGRDERGRFVAKTSAAEGQAAQAAPQGDQQQQAEGQAQPDPYAEPPTGLSASAKAKWAETPAEVRADIHRRDREAQQLAGRMDSERRFGREFADIVRPYAEEFQRAGATPQLAFKTFLNNHLTLRNGTPEQKTALARQMVRDYGLDLNAIAQSIPSDPHVAALHRQIDDLTRKLNAPRNNDFAPLPQAEQDDNVLAHIEAFRADPAHPHFDKVRDTIAALLESGTATDLKDAYDRAVWADPTLRSTLVAQPPANGQAADQGQRQSQPAADRNAAARRAAVSVTGSPGASGQPRPTTLRQELSEQLRAAGIG